MEKAQVLELFELPYSDLLLLSSDQAHSSLSSPAELERLELVKRTIMETLGPMGPGLLSVSGVPNAAVLRHDLPLARRLALLDSDLRNRILKENKLGSDVPLKNPERNVSSFAMQLRYVDQNSNSEGGEFHDRVKGFGDGEFKNLGSDLRELGFCMMELGLRLARICDGAIGGRELELSLLESCAAKGRLIHYHAKLDGQLLLKQRKKGVKKKEKQGNVDVEHGGIREGSGSNLWQQWHYDYGIFTVLTAPLFLTQAVEERGDQVMESGYEECGYPNGHTCLQIFDPNKKGIFMVDCSPENFIIQVGESAEVISKGNLRATLHSVLRPGKLENLSREAFVVFLQPAWDKVLCISDYPMRCLSLEDQYLSISSAEDEEGILEEQNRIEEIEKIVPPLSSRLKDGMTFAEFSRETTRQYYGGSGLQSNSNR
ncbi:Isopenicillin N synthase-like [Parasponia andersonii]|uniref:Isopenicillin N synthase-like n=1 Tax=Parasponia andersonii TaxID=3476 RepID=A0A2P5C052_PARAD|nr:Isopenicillin N synthase-like [Parasponia andersonii]